MNASDITPSVASPCIGICQLNSDSVCLGCGRLISEIVEWTRASEARRRQIVELSTQRLPPLSEDVVR